MMGFEHTRSALTTAGHLPVAVLMRHAERPESSELPGTEVELTKRGRDESFELGRLLGVRVRRIAHSPVLRCRQTAEAILAGSGASAERVLDDRLGGPGLFIEDESSAAATFAALGVPAVLRSLMAGRKLPGMVSPEAGCKAMVEHLLGVCDRPSGLYLFITHDALLAPMLGRLFGRETELPDYLDALLVWRESGALWARHRARIVSAATLLE
jgi:hypothetical protein